MARTRTGPAPSYGRRLWPRMQLAHRRLPIRRPPPAAVTPRRCSRLAEKWFRDAHVVLWEMWLASSSSSSSARSRVIMDSYCVSVSGQERFLDRAASAGVADAAARLVAFAPLAGDCTLRSLGEDISFVLTWEGGRRPTYFGKLPRPAHLTARPPLRRPPHCPPEA